MFTDQTKPCGPAGEKNSCLLIVEGTGSHRVVPLKKDQTLGRKNDQAPCDITVSSRIASRRHGKFFFDKKEGAFYYEDCKSLNGTYINGEKMKFSDKETAKAHRLTDGDILRIDRGNLREPHPEAVLMIYFADLSNEKWNTWFLGEQTEIAIGRGKDCQLKLNDLMASRNHGQLFRDGDRWILRDNNSTNGISVNGNEISGQVTVHRNDVFRMANTSLIFLGDRILYNSGSEKKASLLVDIRKKTVNLGRKVLLRDIHGEFESGDFVLILGGSGAGKTTLIRAILGESRADGKIILNGQDLYRNFKNMKSQIGMVPQFLTLRKNDTVHNTLMDTAAMKLGSQYSREEIAKRVDSVIRRVGIEEHQNKLIGQLSGGQQKKAAVANQLVGFQKVFICDEPDSGLDAASRMQQMEILKEISQENKIVMVITHEPDDAAAVTGGVRSSLFTKVIVLARSSSDKAGHLAYFGDPKGALDFFGVSRLQDIMMEINPPAEGGRGRADHYIEKYAALREGKEN